jgi:hypothetical protein
MLSPYRFVAFSQHTRFVMLVYDVTDQLDASQRVDIPFSTLFAHSPKKSLSLSKLRPFDSLADFFGDGSFLFRLSGERLDLHRALVYLPDAAPAVADRTGTGRAACLRRLSVLMSEDVLLGNITPTAAVAAQFDGRPAILPRLFHSA